MIRKKEREYFADRKKAFFNRDFSKDHDTSFCKEYVEFIKSCIRQRAIKEDYILNPAKGGKIDWFLDKLHFFDRSVRNVMGEKGSLKVLRPSEVDYLMEKVTLHVDEETNYVLHNDIDYTYFLERAKEKGNGSDISLVEKMIEMVDSTNRCILCEADQGEVIHLLPDLLQNLNVTVLEHKSDLRKVFDDCEVFIE